jgi:hypothetical protein
VSRSSRSVPPVRLEEHAALCGRCQHQNGVHTGGAGKHGWAIYDLVWATASGWCKEPGCDCPRRVSILVDRPKPSGDAPQRRLA